MQHSSSILTAFAALLIGCAAPKIEPTAVQPVELTLSTRVSGLVVHPRQSRGPIVEVPAEVVRPLLRGAAPWPWGEADFAFRWISAVDGLLIIDDLPARFRCGTAKVGGQPTVMAIWSASGFSAWEIPEASGRLLLSTLGAAVPEES